MRRRTALAGLMAWIAAPLAAQGVPQGAVAVLDRAGLFARSAFGRRILAEIEAETTELAAENRRIESELDAEERDLTEQRPELSADAFRSLAQEFDTRVEGIRQAQDAKARAIQTKSERAQQAFGERVTPILRALTQETGALVVLDRRLVIASADGIDITQAAVARIDDEIGEGEGLEDSPSVDRPGGPGPAALPVAPDEDERQPR